MSARRTVAPADPPEPPSGGTSGGTEILRVAQQLITMRTANPPGAESAAAHWVAARLAALGADVQVQQVSTGRCNAVGTLDFGPGPTIMLCTHLDVVPAADEAFVPVVRDGRLYGRGACDAKGALAAMLVAAERLRAASDGLRGRLTVAAVCDEEVGATGALHLAGRRPDLDCVVIGEPTDNQLVHRSNGVLRAQLELTGQAGHASRPGTGVSALTAGAEVVLGVDRYHQELVRSGRGSCLVTMAQGGSGVNIIPGQCSLVLDRRMTPGSVGSSVQDAGAELDALLPQWISDPAVRWRRSAAAVSVDTLDTRDDALTARLLTAIGDLTPGQTFPAVTDAPHFAALGAPTYILGPGSIDQAHVAQEWVTVQALASAADRYQQLVRTVLTR